MSTSSSGAAPSTAAEARPPKGKRALPRTASRCARHHITLTRYYNEKLEQRMRTRQISASEAVRQFIEEADGRRSSRAEA